jgi:uncharacterized protein (DUF433 family)
MEAMTFSDLPAAIRRPLTVSEVAAITNVDRKAVNRMIDDGVLPKSFVSRGRSGKSAGNLRLLKPSACPLVLFNVTTGGLVSARFRARIFKKMDRMLKDNTVTSIIEEGALSLNLSGVVGDALERMKDLAHAEASVEINREIRGGMPVLRGTRISVHELADLAGCEEEGNILSAFPGVGPEDIKNAVIYAKAHPLPGKPRKAPSLPKGARKISSSVLDLTDL